MNDVLKSTYLKFYRLGKSNVAFVNCHEISSDNLSLIKNLSHTGCI